MTVEAISRKVDAPRVPFYDNIKLAFILSLCYWRTKATTPIFKWYIHPILSGQQKRITYVSLCRSHYVHVLSTEYDLFLSLQQVENQILDAWMSVSSRLDRLILRHILKKWPVQCLPLADAPFCAPCAMNNKFLNTELAGFPSRRRTSPSRIRRRQPAAAAHQPDS